MESGRQGWQGRAGAAACGRRSEIRGVLAAAAADLHAHLYEDEQRW
jgi:hypothetical protein